MTDELDPTDGSPNYIVYLVSQRPRSSAGPPSKCVDDISTTMA